MKYRSNWTTTDLLGKPIEVKTTVPSNSFGWVGKVAAGLIIGSILVILAWYSLIGYVAVKAVDRVEQQGLESVIMRIWKGPQHERGQDTNPGR